MMKLGSGLVAVALALVPLVSAQSGAYGQCGGTGWTGATTCVSGFTCTYSNPYYSQCIPGTASSSSSTSSKSSTISSSSSTSSKPTTTSTTTAPSATGFVKTSGTKFTLNGSPFTVVGANAYWVGLSGYSTTDMNTAFTNIAATGATTVRTWGFNEVVGGPAYSGQIYYQSWSGSTPTINTGATGLENFDNVVAAAKANGLRLIVALTNNWSDYGGMDVYTTQLLGSADHDLFYTSSQTIAAYQNYIKAFVGRYVNEPTILGWELSNEPRCAGSTGTTSGTCTNPVITAWAKTISAYIKSIDSNHLVAIGDEGFFNDPTNYDYPYTGTIGIDFVANLAISTLDFGTFHNYPQSWGETANPDTWGQQWITDHASAMKNASKPVIMEEFGVTDNQLTTYTDWYNTVISSGLTGDLIWQAGSTLSTGETPNDGYAIYPGTDVYTLDTEHAAALKARG